jgi:hypothetical protein
MSGFSTAHPTTVSSCRARAALHVRHLVRHLAAGVAVLVAAVVRVQFTQCRQLSS